MPTIRKFNNNVNSIPDVNIPKQYDNIVVVDTGNVKQPISTEVVGSIIYANTTQPVSPESLFSQIKNKIPDIVGGSGITDVVFLELLSGVIAMFTSETGHKWNFLRVENKIRLQPGKREYELPNFDQIISVFFERDCNLNYSDRKIEVLQVDSQQKDFLNGVNFFEMVGGNLRLINRKIDEQLNLCGECSKCGFCQQYSGFINVHYHINPYPPQDMHENMMWFPKNPKAVEYFKERLIEDIYIRSGITPQISSKATILLNDLLKWDNTFMKVQNKTSNDYKIFNFQNIYNRRI